MKKLVLLLVSILILLSGCVSQVQPKVQETQKLKASAEATSTVTANEQTGNIKQVIPLKDLPKEYPSQNAIANGDYVDVNGKISNNEIMDEYLKKVSNKENAFIRTTVYTIEGDPIIADFLYENSSFKVTFDSTRDKFGIGQITTKTYKNLVKYQENGRLIYFITDLDTVSSEDNKNGFDCAILKVE